MWGSVRECGEVGGECGKCGETCQVSVGVRGKTLPFSGRTQRGQIFVFFYCINLMFSIYSFLCVKMKFLSQVVFEILAK